MERPPTEIMKLVLHDCATREGNHWFPADLAQRAAIDRSQLDLAVDHLRLGGFLEITDWVQGKGQVYSLTELGREALRNPRLLEAPPPPSEPTPAPVAEAQSWDRTAAILEVFRSPQPPRMTFTLIAMNILVFVFGMTTAMERGHSMGDFISMAANPEIDRIRYETGAFLAGSQWNGQDPEMLPDLVVGHWWKPLTCVFVHHGLIHILANMFALFMLGPFCETIWGRWRFLLIYLFSGLCGSLLVALMYTGNAGPLLAGASGAICGILGSMVPWLVLNRAYLPPQFRAALGRGLFINILIIAGISMMPSVSWEGHLGGGLAGAAMAVPVNFTRFGQPGQRTVGWIAALLLPLSVVGFCCGRLQPTELEYARAAYVPHLLKVDKEVSRVFSRAAQGPLKKLDSGTKLEAGELDRFNTEVTRLIAELNDLKQLLESAPEFSDQRINAAIGHARAYVQATYNLVDRLRSMVNANRRPSEEDIDALERLRNGRREQLQPLQDSILFPARR